MKNFKLLTILTIVFILATASSFARQYFDKSKDLLLACFDLKADEDDVMAATALGCQLQHSDLAGGNYFAVAGAYGKQGCGFITAAVPGHFNLLFGAENTKWTNANSNWSASVTRAKDKVKATLDAGGKVFIQEAGQSDFTNDVLKAVISAGVSSATVKARVIVVQHSTWNEDNATPSKLSWVKSNTDYNKIADGNARYNDKNTTWLSQAKSSSNPNTVAKNFWTASSR